MHNVPFFMGMLYKIAEIQIKHLKSQKSLVMAKNTWIHKNSHYIIVTVGECLIFNRIKVWYVLCRLGLMF